MCGFFPPILPSKTSSSVDFRAVLHELHFWGEFFDGVSAGGLWGPWLGPFEVLHCRILDVFGVIILLQELSSFHLQLFFFWNRQYDVLACWICCYSLGSILPFTRKCYSYKILVLNFVGRTQNFFLMVFLGKNSYLSTCICIPMTQHLRLRQSFFKSLKWTYYALYNILSCRFFAVLDSHI